jgi:hypothetical protein
MESEPGQQAPQWAGRRGRPAAAHYPGLVEPHLGPGGVQDREGILWQGL